MQQQRNGTRMTLIGRISTDTHYPCASVSTVAPVDVAHTYGSCHTWRSVFYRKIAIFEDDNKPQMNADERRYFLAIEFSKIIHRKGRKERKVHRMISFGIRKTTEGTEDTENKNKTLCSLCSQWFNNLARINFSGFNAHALEYSIFTQGETIEGDNLA
ncbi:MAG: hypothetical protein WA144_05045 [Candidatus Methanoperedens sp.]